MPVGLVIPGREKYKPQDVRKWLDWIPRFGAHDLRLGVVGGVIRDSRLEERAKMATFSPFDFAAVDLRGRKGAWLLERQPVVKDKKATGLWNLRFRRIKTAELPPDLPCDVAIRQLRNIVGQALNLSQLERGLSQWSDYLARALQTIDGEVAPEACQDVLPKNGYTDEAHRLITAVCQAWVLGGIMSWNDHVPVDKRRAQLHRKIAGELYACLIEGTISAVNNGLKR